MELFTVIFSVLLTVLTPVGLVVDRTTDNLIRSQFNRVEQLEVRVDNIPSHQLLAGKVEKLRIAGRGLWPTPEMRIAALEIETDPIDLDLSQLQNQRQPSPAILQQPFQGAVRLVLTQADINQALKSPKINEQLQKLINRGLGPAGDLLTNRYEIINPRVEFLGNDRLKVFAELQNKNTSEKLTAQVETGLAIQAGQRLQLVNPIVLVNNQAVPQEFLNLLTSGIGERLNIRILEKQGITARILKLNIEPGEMAIATFIQIPKPAQPSRPPA